MLGLMKAVSFAISFSDSEKTDEEVDKYTKAITKNVKIRKRIRNETIKKGIREMPTFFEYVSYMNCFTTSICGPYIDYMEHKNWMKMRGIHSQIPFPAWPLLKWIFYVLLFCGIFAFLVPMFPYESVMEEEFYEMGFLHKILWMSIIGTVIRSKYYFAFSLQ